MPVATTHHVIRVYFPIPDNPSSAHRLLYRIMSYFTSPPNPRSREEYKKYQLLCRAIFSSYDFKTKTLSLKELEKFYNKNGYPISLDEEILKMKHELWDSVECVTLICYGPGMSRKVIAFERYKGSRMFKYGHR